MFEVGDLLKHNLQPLERCCALVVEVKIELYKIFWIRDVIERLTAKRNTYKYQNYIDSKFQKIS